MHSAEVPLREVTEFSDTPFNDVEYEEAENMQATHFSDMSINGSLFSEDSEETLTDIEDDFLLDDICSDQEIGTDFSDEDEDTSSEPNEKQVSTIEKIVASRSPKKGVNKNISRAAKDT